MNWLFPNSQLAQKLYNQPMRRYVAVCSKSYCGMMRQLSCSTQLMSDIPICHNEIIVQGGLLSSLFMAGLAGSVTHCTGMCGPFVMSFAKCNSPQPGKLARLSEDMLLPYHAGRITTYVLLGTLAALFSHTTIQFFQSPWVANFLPAFLLACGGILFLMQFLGISGVHLPLPSLPRAMHRIVTRLSQNPHGMRGYFMGTILGFLPCGLLLSAVLIAAAAPNVGSAALGMFLFGVSTVPALNAVAFIKNRMTDVNPSLARGVYKGLTLANSLALFLLAGVRLT